MKELQKWQITKMFAISKNIGMSHDDLHVLAGVESIKELDYNAANEVITELMKRQGTPPLMKKPTKEAVPGGMTTGQKAKIWALLYQLQALDVEPNSTALGDRLCGIIKKELKVDSTAKNPFQWLTFQSGNKLIEIIKKYLISAQKKAGGADGIG